MRNEQAWGEGIHDLIDRCTRLSPGERPAFAEVAKILKELCSDAKSPSRRKSRRKESAAGGEGGEGGEGGGVKVAEAEGGEGEENVEKEEVGEV